MRDLAIYASHIEDTSCDMYMCQGADVAGGPPIASVKSEPVAATQLRGAPRGPLLQGVTAKPLQKDIVTAATVKTATVKPEFVASRNSDLPTVASKGHGYGSSSSSDEDGDTIAGTCMILYISGDMSIVLWLA